MPSSPMPGIMHDNASRRPLLFFCFCVVFYCVYLILLQGDWVLSGEMWAEMGTNYYPSANVHDWAQRLFATDAGYVPLPQRLIAIGGSLLHLPAASIPYFYTWSAILSTAAMVGSFCLRPFRLLVRSDGLRLLTSIAILMMADFDTRTFINFTYFAAFFIAIVTALALADSHGESPWWAWFIPVLFISKPAVLAALPAMMVAAVVGRKRFRLITGVALLLCVAQFVRIMLSHTAGTFAGTQTFSLGEKIFAAAKYFFGFTGAYAGGKDLPLNWYHPLWLGLLVVAVSLAVVLKKRSSAGALIIVGLSLVLFNVFLNAFALSDAWNTNMERLDGVPLYRHIIVAYFGVVLVVTGLVAAITHRSRSPLSTLSTKLGPILFATWFILSGWFSFAVETSRTPGMPNIGESQWQAMSDAIDSGRPICVPIDPFGWMFQRDCESLTPDVNWVKPLTFQSITRDGLLSVTDIPVPAALRQQKLLSMAVLIKPHIGQRLPVNGRVTLTMNDGAKVFLVGARQLSSNGGILMVEAQTMLPIERIASAALTLDQPVDIAFIGDAPAVIWMGKR
ncbi:MAG: hypothetical protein ACRYHA_13815 [Janthinobacterium lividum]